MNIISGITLFLVIWWVVIFVMLPIGIKRADHEIGHQYGAPVKTNLKKKCIWTTLISIILWLIAFIAVEIFEII